ncbi:MAG TPA: hypothetical protein VGC94_08660 [Amnibacterium sp.]
METPQPGNRKALLVGLALLLVGFVLVLLPLGTVGAAPATALFVAAVVVMLKGFGWQFTRRF